MLDQSSPNLMTSCSASDLLWFILLVKLDDLEAPHPSPPQCRQVRQSFVEELSAAHVYRVQQIFCDLTQIKFWGLYGHQRQMQFFLQRDKTFESISVQIICHCFNHVLNATSEGWTGPGDLCRNQGVGCSSDAVVVSPGGDGLERPLKTTTRVIIWRVRKSCPLVPEVMEISSSATPWPS